MSAKSIQRGFDPEDHKWFSSQNIPKLRTAQKEIQWLLDRDYPISPVIEFVGNHHQLSSRQRMALFRVSASQCQYQSQASRLLPLAAAKNSALVIDGFNQIITLEVALSGSPLIRGGDDVLRDLAGLRGSYRLIDHCLSWFNLSKAIIATAIEKPWIVVLN